MRRLRLALQRTGGASGLLALVWLFGAATLSLAQAPMSAAVIEKMRKTKAPEDWTLEERLAVRFDQEDIRMRREASKKDLLRGREGGSEAEGLAAEQDDTLVVLGGRNPELLVPTEIFDDLLKNGFLAEEIEKWRAPFEDGLRGAGLDPASFWPELEKAASGVIRIHQEFYEISQKLQKATPTERKELDKRLEKVGAGLCFQRAEGLAAARKRFGQKRIDRFLYRVVAPMMFSLSSPDPDWPDQLRQREEGCHASK